MSIEPAKDGSRTVYARVGIWYDEGQRMIHITIPGSGWFHTTVSNDAGSKRYHPNLFQKLRRVLEEQGRWDVNSLQPGSSLDSDVAGIEDAPAQDVESKAPGANESARVEAGLESSFHAAMAQIYVRAKAEAGYNATRYLQMVSENGGLATANQLLHASNVSDGFTHLWERGRLDLSVEALVLEPKWSPLFTSDDLRIARERLKAYGFEA